VILKGEKDHIVFPEKREAERKAKKKVEARDKETETLLETK